MVQPIAIRLANIYCQENIFYDSWTMQPGDGIIDKMNEGLEQCTHFFFFISKNSLNSNFVKLEWQNALYKETKLPTSLKFVGLNLDNSEVPDLISQKIFIDIYSSGIEVALAQMIDVINGKNTFKPITFSNLSAFISYISPKEIKIECRAKYYLEPSCRFVLFFDNNLEDLSFTCDYDSMITCGTNKRSNPDIEFYFVAVERALTIDFPFVITAKSIKENINLKQVGHAYTHNAFKPIHLVLNN